MIERTPFLNLATHLIVAFGLVLILVPIWLAFVAATHDPLARHEFLQH